MNDIDSRTYGHEPAATQLRELRQQVKDGKKLIAQLLDNAEIDALNEPELIPLCKRASKFLATK